MHDLWWLVESSRAEQRARGAPRLLSRKVRRSWVAAGDCWLYQSRDPHVLPTAGLISQALPSSDLRWSLFSQTLRKKHWCLHLFRPHQVFDFCFTIIMPGAEEDQFATRYTSRDALQKKLENLFADTKDFEIRVSQCIVNVHARFSTNTERAQLWNCLKIFPLTSRE